MLFWFALGWIVGRKVSGLSIVPKDVFHDGALLVFTQGGHAIAVPADTPVKDPTSAVLDGDLDVDSAIFGSADQPAQVLMGGFGDPWNPFAGVGDDYEPGLYGLLRSTSISARRRV